jgi:hypothetical protein
MQPKQVFNIATRVINACTGDVGAVFGASQSGPLQSDLLRSAPDPP